MANNRRNKIKDFLNAFSIKALPLGGSWRGLCLCGLLAFLCSCSEDALEADFRNPTSYFVPADGDTTQTAQLRRQFYKDNGVYLLFSDTLQNKFQGTDINGDSVYFTETIDIGYNVGQTSVSSTTYKYGYLRDYEQQKAAVDYAQDYVLNHLTGKLRPYSLFLCKSMVGENSNTGSTLRPYAMSNQRCMVVAVGYLLAQNRSESQKQALSRTVLNSVIGQMAQNNSAAFANFFAYSAKYYDANYADFGMEGTTADVQSVGFLSSGSVGGTFPNQNTDLTVYVTQAIQYTEEDFNQKYPGLTVCQAKFAEVKRVLKELGYKE